MPLKFIFQGWIHDEATLIKLTNDSANMWQVITWGNDDIYESLGQHSALNIICAHLIRYMIICKRDVPLVQFT